MRFTIAVLLCFVACANRCGVETVNGHAMATYLGNSVITGPHGDLLMAARPGPTLLIACWCPADSGRFHPARTHDLEDRRPELY